MLLVERNNDDGGGIGHAAGKYVPYVRWKSKNAKNECTYRITPIALEVGITAPEIRMFEKMP